MWPDKTVNPYGIPPRDPAAGEHEQECSTCGSTDPRHHPLHGDCPDPFHPPRDNDQECDDQDCEVCGYPVSPPAEQGEPERWTIYDFDRLVVAYEGQKRSADELGSRLRRATENAEAAEARAEEAERELERKADRIKELHGAVRARNNELDDLNRKLDHEIKVREDIAASQQNALADLARLREALKEAARWLQPDGIYREREASAVIRAALSSENQEGR